MAGSSNNLPDYHYYKVYINNTKAKALGHITDHLQRVICTDDDKEEYVCKYCEKFIEGLAASRDHLTWCMYRRTLPEYPYHRIEWNGYWAVLVKPFNVPVANLDNLHESNYCFQDYDYLDSTKDNAEANAYRFYTSELTDQEKREPGFQEMADFYNTLFEGEVAFYLCTFGLKPEWRRKLVYLCQRRCFISLSRLSELLNHGASLVSDWQLSY